jgi:soluble lytic murein transglycosylase-like protein
MRSCFFLGLLFAVCAASNAPLQAESRSTARSVVRADAKTGQLVRRTFVRHPSREAAHALHSDLARIVDEISAQHGVDPHLVRSVIRVESNYNQYAVSPKGAQGLMQLMPGTAKRFGVANSFDPRENIEGGVRYLKYLHGLFPEDLRLVLAAYNAGEEAVNRYGDIPPYAETQAYVRSVSHHYEQARNRQIASAEKPVPAMDDSGHPPIEVVVDAEGRFHYRTR